MSVNSKLEKLSDLSERYMVVIREYREMDFLEDMTISHA